MQLFYIYLLNMEDKSVFTYLMEMNKMQNEVIVKSLYVDKTYRQSQEKQHSVQYVKRWIVRLSANNTEDYLQNFQKWVKWVHNPTGPRKDNDSTVSFVTGWIVYPNGQIKLTTPYGDK